MADPGGLHVEVGRPTRERYGLGRERGDKGGVAVATLVEATDGRRVPLAALGGAERGQAHRLERLLDRPLDRGVGREVGRGLADGRRV